MAYRPTPERLAEIRREVTPDWRLHGELFAEIDALTALNDELTEKYNDLRRRHESLKCDLAWGTD